MKTNITLSVCVFFLLSFSFLPLHSQEKIVETQYYKNNPELGGDVIIKSSTRDVKGEKSYTSFEIEAKAGGSYNLNFWFLPGELKDGSFSSYDVLVNGKSAGKITPVRGNWQSIGLEKAAKVTLRSGTNTISVVTTIPDVAEVEFIRLSTDVKKAAISSSAYDEYLKKAQEQSAIQSAMTNVLSEPDSIGTLPLLELLADNPEGNYTYYFNFSFNYTFYASRYFSAGQQINVSTNAPVYHFIEFFSSTNPSAYSWTASSSYSSSTYNGSLNVTIPVTGYYYTRVRTYYNGTQSTANVNINGTQYSNVTIYSKGVRVTQDNSTVYNTFTSHLTSGDPRLWIEEGPSTPGRIVAYNDDWHETSNFYWRYNSRIRKQYTNTVYAVLLTSYSSYNPVGNCDLYAKCKNSNITSWFPNLLANDAIQSAPASYVYNCISWSGGITEYWEWPPSPSSDYYVANNPLASFDLFYRFPRYNGCGIFTRNDATSENSVVDLWALGTSDSNYQYTHASVTKGADDHPHGYDWESKPGSLMRTFHPRNSLNGNSYGNVVKWYRRFATGVVESSTYTLAEAIADGQAVIENVHFDETELSLIQEGIEAIPETDINTFNSLFDAWKPVWTSSLYSNPYKFKENAQYASLLTFCQSNPSAILLVYDRLNSGEQFAFMLVEDLTLVNNSANQEILNSVKKANEQSRFTSAGASIVRSPYINSIKYVKALLANENKIHHSSKSLTDENDLTGIRYSNEDEFGIVNNATGISIGFSLKEDSRISVSVVNLRGEEIASILNEQPLTSGNHTYNVNLTNSGIYLVKYIVDGNVNVKKVFVK